MTSHNFAPIHTVPVKEIVAVEHPMVVKNIDKALQTFGRGMPFKQVGTLQLILRLEHFTNFLKMLNAEDYEGSVPLYLRSQDPMCPPLLSHNASTTNVLLKITVPQRTGRKRKRGSTEPFLQDPGFQPNTPSADELKKGQSSSLLSHSRQDNPRSLLRTLQDNVNNYEVEVVGKVEQTHRFRGRFYLIQSAISSEHEL
jgi:general transcription factor 3C polypeptide 5 (transcription factor C subunit 1)